MGIGQIGQPAVFLDRDGVLNPTILNPATGRKESPLNPDDFRLFDGVLDGLSDLQKHGYPLILVSNQPNYALGKSSLELLGAIHHKFACELLRAGISFTRFSYCLHHPRGITAGYSGLCVCRKPSPWFLFRARDDFGYSLRESWMIGDQPTDTQCGQAAGVRTIRVNPDPSEAAQSFGARADYFARNLLEAAQIILNYRAR